MIPPKRPCFTADDMQRAFDQWGANCGPGAIAAIVGLTLEELRPHLGDFEAKRYTNPTLMFETLNRLGVAWRKMRTDPLIWPSYGLARIQWEGPWTAPGASPKWAYRQTHWVGAYRGRFSVGIFDVNVVGNGSGWCSLEDWQRTVVPWILSEAVPRANGRWHITHSIEVPA